MGEHHQWPGNHRDRRQHAAGRRAQPVGQACDDHQQRSGRHHAQRDLPKPLSWPGQGIRPGLAAAGAYQHANQHQRHGNRQVQVAPMGKRIGRYTIEQHRQQYGRADAEPACGEQVEGVRGLHRRQAAQRAGHRTQGKGRALFQAQEGHYQCRGDRQAGQQPAEQAAPATRGEGDGPHQERGDDQLEVEQGHRRAIHMCERCARRRHWVGRR
ncbi:hypothetical protein D3C81_1303460 [compost metagenome]